MGLKFQLKINEKYQKNALKIMVFFMINKLKIRLNIYIKNV